jgi:hypothetical protein
LEPRRPRPVARQDHRWHAASNALEMDALFP